MNKFFKFLQIFKTPHKYQKLLLKKSNNFFSPKMFKNSKFSIHLKLQKLLFPTFQLIIITPVIIPRNIGFLDLQNPLKN